MGSPVKVLLSIGMVMVLAACGKPKSKKPDPPCGAGVNANVCGYAVIETSSWSQVYKTWSEDPQTNKPIPGTEKTATLVYEFKPGPKQPFWRRSLIVETATGTQSMIEQGEVEKIDGNSLTLTVLGGSCGDSSDRTKIYYQRTGASLRIDNKLIETRKIKNIGDLFVAPMVDLVGEAMRLTVETIFTGGSSAQTLRSGRASLSLEAPAQRQARTLLKSDLGCFNSFGTGFRKTNQSLEPL